MEQRDSVTAIPSQRFFVQHEVASLLAVPRINPVPETEKAIGRRLREFRTESGISQAEFARRAGVDSRALGTYEHGRVQLPFYVFLRAHKQFNISPLWLAIGVGAKRLDWYFEEDYFSRAIGERELFSAVWERDLKESCARESANLSETIGFTICDLDELTTELGHPVVLPHSQLRVLLSRAQALANRLESLLKDAPSSTEIASKRKKRA